MTDERPNNEATSDENVSRVYRELARERAPDKLNAAVLTAAQQAARPRYARSRAWTRPLAWAATVVLTVGIVLELTRVPELNDASYELSAPKLQQVENDADALADTPLDEVEEVEEEVPASIAPGRASNVTPATPEKTSFSKAVASQLPAEPELEKRKNEAGEGLASSVREAPAPAAVDDFRQQDKDLMRRAEEIAESQYSDNKEALAVEVAREQARSLESSMQANRPEASICAEEARRTPEGWLECIEQLEQAGQTDIATEQRRQLAEAFPDFKAP